MSVAVKLHFNSFLQNCKSQVDLQFEDLEENLLFQYF